MIFGDAGCGKSTFGSEAPNPIFIDAEKGSKNLSVARFDDSSSYPQIMKNIQRLANEDHKFETVVLDTLDSIEPMIFKHVCLEDPKKPDVIEDACGGYGKGYTRANQFWKEMMAQLSLLRDKKKMNIIAIAHSHIKPYNDPAKPMPYDRHILKFNEKAAALWREHVDCMLFVNEETLTNTPGKNDKKIKAYGEGKKIVYSQRRPSFDAKNRYGLPFEMPLGWSHFEAARKSGNPDSLETILSDLSEMILPADKKESLKNAIEKANGNIEQLIKIRNYARTLAGE